MQVQRNAPCPCGSGKKYKRCCALSKNESAKQSVLPLLLVSALIVGILAIIFGIANSSNRPEPARVWSAEHGHWHTVP